MKLGFSVILIFATVIIMFLPMQEVWACSCARASTIEHYDHSDIVFVGTVMNTELSTSSYETGGIWSSINSTTIITTFDVNSKWKGDLNDSISVESNRDGASCGYNFQNNTTYLVFAYDTFDDYPSTSLCSGNQLIPDGSEPNFIEYVLLNGIYESILIWWLLILIVSIPVIAVIIFVVKRKLKSRIS